MRTSVETELPIEKAEHFGRRKAALQGALKHVDEQQTVLLEFAEDGVARLPFRGDLEGFEKQASFAGKLFAFGVEIGTLLGRHDCAEKQSLDVDRPVACGPFKALEPSSNMGGRGELPAAVTGEQVGI